MEQCYPQLMAAPSSDGRKNMEKRANSAQSGDRAAPPGGRSAAAGGRIPDDGGRM